MRHSLPRSVLCGVVALAHRVVDAVAKVTVEQMRATLSNAHVAGDLREYVDASKCPRRRGVRGLNLALDSRRRVKICGFVPAYPIMSRTSQIPPVGKTRYREVEGCWSVLPGWTSRRASQGDVVSAMSQNTILHLDEQADDRADGLVGSGHVQERFCDGAFCSRELR